MLNSTDAATQSRPTVLAEMAPVVVTSVVTETVRPTWIFTESVVVFTNTVNSEETTSLSKTSTQGAEPTKTAQMQTSPPSLQVDTTAPTSVLTTLPSMVNPASRSAESWPGLLGPLTVQTSWESVPTLSSSSQSPSPSSSQSSSSPTLVTTSTTVRPSVLPSMSPSTSASTPFIETKSSTSPLTISPTSPSHTPSYTPLTGLGSDSSSSQSPSGKPHGHSPSTGTIVGSAIGGAAVVALSLLACILFFHRKRSLSHQRRASRQRLLRTSDSISSIEGFHRRRFLQPLPVAESPVMSSAPVFLPPRYPIPLDSRPSSALAVSYPNLSHGKTYPYGEPPHNPLDPFTHPEDRPLDRPLSTIIEVSPPSSTASVYSRASWDGGLKEVESHDSTQVSPHNYSYPSQSTLTLETAGSRSRYLNTAESDSRRRSDPFDLEPPPNTLQWPLTSAPLPNRWGDRFSTSPL